jgi:hypothetical protein
MNPKMIINNPTGTRFAESRSGRKVGTIKSGGGVNVGNRVGVTGSMKAAASVGSIVGVEREWAYWGREFQAGAPF